MSIKLEAFQKNVSSKHSTLLSKAGAKSFATVGDVNSCHVSFLNVDKLGHLSLAWALKLSLKPSSSA